MEQRSWYFILLYIFWLFHNFKGNLWPVQSSPGVFRMYAASFRKTEVTYVTLLFSAFILKCTKEERSRK